MKLSIIIPCFNEERTLREIYDRVSQADIGSTQKEIIFVNDYSSDSTPRVLEEIKKSVRPPGLSVITINHRINAGKGRAIRTGLQAATGDIVLIQDADLEYNPNDYSRLLQPILEQGAQVVYGSRFLNNPNARSKYDLFQMGTQLVTFVTNILYNVRLTDEPTCYKVFKADVIKNIPLTCLGFEFCPEVTAKVLRKHIPIIEVPISYTPRSRKEGKKIKMRDGFIAIWTLIKYRFKSNK